MLSSAWELTFGTLPSWRWVWQFVFCDPLFVFFKWHKLLNVLLIINYYYFLKVIKLCFNKTAPLLINIKKVVKCIKVKMPCGIIHEIHKKILFTLQTIFKNLLIIIWDVFTHVFKSIFFLRVSRWLYCIRWGITFFLYIIIWNQHFIQIKYF